MESINHDIKKNNMTSRNMLWRQKVCHDFKKYVIAEKNWTHSPKKHHNVKWYGYYVWHDVKKYAICQEARHDFKKYEKYTMMSKHMS